MSFILRKQLFSLGFKRGLLQKTTRRFNSSFHPVKPPPQQPKKGFKALVHEYGYSGIAVYLGLGLLDLPLCYLLVHSTGEEEIRTLQDKFLNWVGWKSDESLEKDKEQEQENEKKQTSTFWTELAVAYALHKTLIVVRLPLTAAITPPIVRKLRSMGFNVGHIVNNTAKNLGKKATGRKYDPTASNPKFGKRPSKGQRWFFF